MELHDHQAEFDAAGVSVAVVTPEPVRRIRRFVEQTGVTIPILADEDSEVIKCFGILNTLIAPDEDRYGLPFPGTYLLDGDGTVLRKHFHRRYQIREAASALLRGDLDSVFDSSAYPTTTIDGAGDDPASISVTLGAPDLKPLQRVELLVRMQLEPGLHVYGDPIPEGYVATTVEVSGPDDVVVEPARMPPTKPFRVEGLSEQFHVLDGDLEIGVPIMLDNVQRRPEEPIPLEVTVRYQACSDHECRLPVTAHTRLEVLSGALNRAPPRPE